MKSTSSALHTLNGLVIFSTSCSQKCISLSSTEAEWYSASSGVCDALWFFGFVFVLVLFLGQFLSQCALLFTRLGSMPCSAWSKKKSGVCDALYLHHIISFITDNDVDPLILQVDNSAVRMISLKQAAGRLRHIKGRLLWLQSKVASQELRIKQVKTIFNVSDVKTTAMQKDRILGLLFLLGFTSDGAEVGSDEFGRLQSKELMKNQIKVVSRVLLNEPAVMETCAACST